jgi:hypothetical protein
MSEMTPSQAEGERDGTPEERRFKERPDFPRTTPSQAEGEDDTETDQPGPSDGG